MRDAVDVDGDRSVSAGAARLVVATHKNLPGVSIEASPLRRALAAVITVVPSVPSVPSVPPWPLGLNICGVGARPPKVEVFNSHIRVDGARACRVGPVHVVAADGLDNNSGIVVVVVQVVSYAVGDSPVCPVEVGHASECVVGAVAAAVQLDAHVGGGTDSTISSSEKLDAELSRQARGCSAGGR